MKTKLITILASLIAVAASNAMTVSFSNSNGSFSNVLAVSTSSGATIADGSGLAAVGFFSDEAAVATGDFSSWVQFGTGSAMGDGAAGDAPSVFIASESITVTSGDTFDGQSLFLYVSFNNEHLVAKSDSVTFTFDNPVSAGEIALQDGGFSYLYGGASGPDVDLSGSGNFIVSSVQLQAVPEPSTFAALAGLCALGAVMVRRRRA